MHNQGALVGTTIIVVTVLSHVLLAGGQPVNLVGQWDQYSGSYADVWGDGDFAYIGHFGDPAVNIIDISTPGTPVGIEYALPPANASASAQDVKVGDDLLFIAMEGGSSASCHIVDVRDPMNPVGLVDIDIEGFTAIHNVFYEGGFLYMADSGTPRVGIVDLRTFDPDNPPAQPITSVLWMLEDVGTSFVHDITVQHGRMYASAWDSGLQIYDITNVDTQLPQLIGQTPDGGDNTHSCWATDDGNFVVTGEERPDGGIKVYRITDNGGFLTLQLTDQLAFPGDAFSVHNQLIAGNRLYNAWYEAGLWIHDINPTTGLLELVGSYATPGSAWGTYPFLGQDRILVSDISGGLLIVALESDVPGDLDGDGIVGVLDFLMLLAAWGPCPEPCPPACLGDLNEDCTVDTNDFLALLANWTM